MVENLVLNRFLKKNKLLFISLFAFCSPFIIKPARAVTITIPLNYTVEASDNQNLTLSGQMVIDTSVSGSENRTQIFGVRTSRGGSGPVSIPDWITSVTLNYADSGDSSNNFTATKATFGGMSWEPKVAGSVDFDSDLVDQFHDIAFYTLGGSITSLSPLKMDVGEDEFELTSTPSPLVFMGILPFLNYSRKLKKTIESAKCYRNDPY